jgi:hypothetical protein
MANGDRLNFLLRWDYACRCWLWPEMRFFKTRRDAIRAARRKGGWLILPASGLWGICMAPVFIVPSEIWPNLSLSLRISTTVGALLVFAGGAGVFLFMLRMYMRPRLRAALIEGGVPICLKCGYDLRENETGICPECGYDSRRQIPRREA